MSKESVLITTKKYDKMIVVLSSAIRLSKNRRETYILLNFNEFMQTISLSKLNKTIYYFKFIINTG